MRKFYDIPIGKNNAISRKKLAEKWGVNERDVRRIIAKLRAEDNGDDYVIVAFSSGRGYYRTNDIQEIYKYKCETIRRARNTFAPLKKVRRVLLDSEREARGNGGNGMD